MNKTHRLITRSPLAAAVALGLFTAPMAQAFEFTRGELTGSWDTTVSYGINIRTEDPATDLIGKATLNPAITFPPPPAPGGLPGGIGGQVIPGLPAGLNVYPGSPGQLAAPGRLSVNRDDGNIKYDKGDLWSNAFKITSELSLNYGDWGAFARATYFYDWAVEGSDYMSEEALEWAGSDFKMLDYFIFYNYSFGEESQVQGTMRLGSQVISWGESTFLQGGINVINPIDASRLRVAGAELKEAFLPVGAFYGSMQFSEALSVEAFYQYEWKNTEIDPSGTYFATNDFASPGGSYVMLGFGTVTQPVWNPDLYDDTCKVGTSSQTNIANSDRYDQLVAQYGAAGAAQILTTACNSAGARLEDNDPRDSGQFGLALRWFAEGLNQTEFGFYAMNYHSRLPLLSARAVTTILPAPIANTAALIVEYPEDIQLYGISFNTSLPGGIAWQGELSYRPNAPMQLDDVEVLFAALSPINLALQASGAPPATLFTSQLGQYNPGAYVKGYTENSQTQLQMTFTKVFAQSLGADQISLVGEFGATDVSLDDGLRYEGEGTDTGGGCDLADVYPQASFPSTLFTQPGCLRNPQTQVGGFPTDFAWGYRLAARADYNSVGGSAWNMSPRLAFAHDVNGTSPSGGNFMEDRMAVTAGVNVNYLGEWFFDVAYTSFFGAEDFNQIYDRDFVSLSVQYSF
jgi:hypothetical protein